MGSLNVDYIKTKKIYSQTLAYLDTNFKGHSNKLDQSHYYQAILQNK